MNQRMRDKMGWNCFQAEYKENPTGPKTIGETLRQKFPRLYSFIQRVKENGAPSRIKKRFRRRQRISPDNSPQASDLIQKQPAVNITSPKVIPNVQPSHGRALSRQMCSNEKQTKDQENGGIGHIKSNTTRAAVWTSEEDLHDGMEIIVSPDEQGLDILAEHIVSEVLERVTETERLPSPSSDGLLGDIANAQVDISLSPVDSLPSVDAPVKKHQHPNIPRIIVVRECGDDHYDQTGEDNNIIVKGKDDDKTGRPEIKEMVDGRDAKGDTVSSGTDERIKDTDVPSDGSDHFMRRKSDGYNRCLRRTTDKYDLPLQRILGQDDLLKLGLEISKRNAAPQIRKSLDSVLKY